MAINGTITTNLTVGAVMSIETLDIQKIDFSQSTILVYGDVMLDRYWFGDTERISPEAPIPVVHVQRKRQCVGGAGNVALGTQSLGATVRLFGLCGDDDAGDDLEKLLEQNNVISHLCHVAGNPTTVKLRIMSHDQQLLRLDFEKKAPAEDDLIQDLVSHLNGAQVLIISDYAKGVIGDVSNLIATAKQHGVVVFVDPKNMDFSVYRGATLITPNRKEFEAVVGVCHSNEERISKARVLLEQFSFDSILITLGKDGMLFVPAVGAPLHLPAHKQEVFDVTGAGDTVIATLACAIASGFEWAAAVLLSNVAAGLAVTKLGTATISSEEIIHELRLEQGGSARILNKESLAALVRVEQQKGRKVVMTNGCFDILHPGHVAYLQEARALGDCLIVAVNDDESVRAQNKGTNRPINPLVHRMAVLAGLQAVDWVIPFSEETPEELISAVLPDILVKGSDWQGKTIAGAKAVEHNGGEVKFLTFIDGYSTTAIIEKICRGGS
jgi:D-beta-D-heptose 7-phosphate kinase/D-beta-D-heptose 1-phosphate adenosyltransferase